MYKLLIFLLTVILSTFELIAYFLFEKSLDSDILILLLIGILPTVLGKLREDIISLYELRKGRVSKKILQKKLFTLLLEKFRSYSLFLAGGIFVLAILFILIGNSIAVSYCLGIGMGLITCSALIQITLNTLEIT